MHEPVQHDESGERLGRQLTERCVHGAVERTWRLDGLDQAGQRRTERREHIRGVRLGRRLDPAERRGERRRTTDHVLEHAAHGEVCARRRRIELVLGDPRDDRAEHGPELIQLIQHIHGSSSVRELRRLAIAAEREQLGDTGIGDVRLDHAASVSGGAARRIGRSPHP